MFEELQRSIQDVAERVGPSVVGLGRHRGRGTGIVIGPDRILTSAHNLRRDEVTVRFADGREERARAVGVDVDGDIAVLAADTGDAPAVEWAEGEVSLGTPVFGLANPGGRGLRVTFGLVSSTGRTFRGPRGRRVSGNIEHTAPLPRGSSGGPLVDTGGRLLGINTLRLDGGLILAIAADGELRTRAEGLARGESPARARLGIAVAPPRVARHMRRAVGLPERDGVLVRGVADGGPAAAAGLQRGDLIVAVDGRELPRLDDLFEALDGASGSVALTVVRGIEETSVRVVLSGEE